MKILIPYSPSLIKWRYHLFAFSWAKSFYSLLFAHIFIIFSLCFQSAAEEKLNSPQHIISFSPSITEVLFALGAGHRVIGVTDFCQFPEEAKLLPKVGGLLNPNVEAIISLQPDLLIHHYDSKNIKSLATQLGIQSLSVSFDNLENIYRSIENIGLTLEEQEQANKLLKKLQDKIRSYQSNIQNHKPKSVLIVLGDSEDPLRDLYAVGKGTFLDELLTLAGGQNIISSSFALYPKVSLEFVISASPEIIIIAGPKIKLSQKIIRTNKKQWDRFSTIIAVRDENIHYIETDYILIPGPRLTQTLGELTRIIHPEAGKHYGKR